MGYHENPLVQSSTCSRAYGGPSHFIFYTVSVASPFGCGCYGVHINIPMLSPDRGTVMGTSCGHTVHPGYRPYGL
ncbi:hypothetical protein BDV32DRAFT_125023 [Aspergillus pseudonomiae]|nr:hypothetical protein BDV32DRAFT_125023 [Aspergillus pseudonomiae]